MTKEERLAILRAEVASLEQELKVDGQPSREHLDPSWENSGCTIEDDWNYSANHWTDWSSSSC